MGREPDIVGVSVGLADHKGGLVPVEDGHRYVHEYHRVVLTPSNSPAADHFDRLLSVEHLYAREDKRAYLVTDKVRVLHLDHELDSVNIECVVIH